MPPGCLGNVVREPYDALNVFVGLGGQTYHEIQLYGLNAPLSRVETVAMI